MKQLLFSVTKSDFDMQTFRCPGAGGGGKDTSSSGVRLIHRFSGAVGEGRETRSVTQNRRAAFERLIRTTKFQSWFKIECAKRSGKPIPETPEQIRERVDHMVDEGLRDGSIQVEVLPGDGV